MDYFCCCRLVRLSFVFHWPSLSPSPPHLGDKPPLWAVLFRADWIGWPCFAASIVPVWKVSRLSKCVDAVRSLTMSIFLLVRFVTSVTKKKAFFRSVTDAWPFSPTSSAWSGTLFCSWRESLTSICTFSCLRNSGCLRCQGKAALCLAQSSKLAGLKKKDWRIHRVFGRRRYVWGWKWHRLCCQRADQELWRPRAGGSWSGTCLVCLGLFRPKKSEIECVMEL